jgi:hypothetical protein
MVPISEGHVPREGAAMSLPSHGWDAGGADPAATVAGHAEPSLCVIQLAVYEARGRAKLASLCSARKHDLRSGRDQAAQHHADQADESCHSGEIRCAFCFPCD